MCHVPWITTLSYRYLTPRPEPFCKSCFQTVHMRSHRIYTFTCSKSFHTCLFEGLINKLINKLKNCAYFFKTVVQLYPAEQALIFNESSDVQWLQLPSWKNKWKGWREKKENPVTSPLESFFDSLRLSASFNVQDGWRTLMSSFALQNKLALQTSTANILYILVIFNYNFSSSWRCRAGHKGKFWWRQVRYLLYSCMLIYLKTTSTTTPTFLARQKI